MELLQNIKEYLNINNLIIFMLVTYITITSSYVPTHLLSILSSSIFKLLTLMLIFYYSNHNILISILISISLIVTLIKYHFNKIEPFTINETEEEFNSESDDEEFNSESESDDEEFNGESESDDEEFNGESESEDEDTRLDEGFDPSNLKSSNNLNDSFTNLHKTIHELQNFISKNK